VPEWIGFSNADAADIKVLTEFFPGAAGVKDLRIGEFIAYNRDSRAERRGKLF
jgi:hypothetical protein